MRLRRQIGIVAAILAICGLASTSAWAAPATTCVKATKVKPPKPGKTHYTGGYTEKGCATVSATHEGEYEKLSDFSESEEHELKELLKYVKVEASGIDSKPTVQFHNANVQVVNGEGRTASTNGAGNLVIGYDENAPIEYCTEPLAETKLECEQNGGQWIVTHRAQTGSHNLILGEEQSFTSYGGLLAGSFNASSAPFASVTGGEDNRATGNYSSILGGVSEEASTEFERRPRPSVISATVNEKTELFLVSQDPGTSASVSQLAAGEYEVTVKGVGSGCPLLNLTAMGSYEVYTRQVQCEPKTGTGKFKVLTSTKADQSWYFSAVGIE